LGCDTADGGILNGRKGHDGGGMHNDTMQKYTVLSYQTEEEEIISDVNLFLSQKGTSAQYSLQAQ
jgi:hypothetical protein